MSISSTRFTQTYNETMAFYKANFSSYAEPKRLKVVVTEFGDVFDKEENYDVYSGLEKEIISKIGFVKCRKSDATHHIIVCETVGDNGIVSGLKTQGWFCLS